MFENPEQCIEKRERCVVCGSTDTRTLAQLPFASQLMSSYWEQAEPFRDQLQHLTNVYPYQVEQCNRCELIFQTYVLRPEFEEVLYSDVNEKYYPGIRTQKWDNKGKFKYYTKTLEYASSIFSVIEDKAPEEIKVLDFGAGWGYFSLAARSFGYQVDAAELNKSKVAHLQSLGIPCVTLPLEKQYDFVFADQVFEHLQNPVEFLRMLAAGLIRPGGHILLGVPTFEANGLPKRFANGDSKTVQKFYPFYHITMYTQNALQELGRQVGLKPVDYQPLMKANLYRLEDGLVPKMNGWLKDMGKSVIKAIRPTTARLFNGVQMYKVEAEI